MSAATTLDVITMGRASVDLYGQQIGSRLEDTEPKLRLQGAMGRAAKLSLLEP